MALCVAPEATATAWPPTTLEDSGPAPLQEVCCFYTGQMGAWRAQGLEVGLAANLVISALLVRVYSVNGPGQPDRQVGTGHGQTGPHLQLLH